MAAREEAFSHYTVELMAANGRLRYEQSGRRVEWQAAVAGLLKGYQVLGGDVEILQTGMNRYQWHVTEQLATLLSGGAGHHLCSGVEALTTLTSMHGIVGRHALAR